MARAQSTALIGSFAHRDAAFPVFSCQEADYECTQGLRCHRPDYAPIAKLEVIGKG
jgi:hypothetical protein